jgi:hypothetical protein
MLAFSAVIRLGLVIVLCPLSLFAAGTDTTTLSRIEGRNGCQLHIQSVVTEAGPQLLLRGLQIRPGSGTVSFDVALPVTAPELDTLIASVKAAQVRCQAGAPRSHLSGHTTRINHHLGFSLGAVTESDQLTWRTELTLKPEGHHFRIVALHPDQLSPLQQALMEARLLLGR